MQASEVKTADGISIHVKKWNHLDNSDRTLLIIHGLGEHQNRYSHVADHFASDGFTVYSYDQRGHGKSGGPRGHSPGIDSNVDDMKCVIESIPHENIYLYCHSFGGNVLVNFMLKVDCATLRGAVMSGAWLKLYEEPSFLDVTLATIMSFIYPKFSQDSKIDSAKLSNIKQVCEDYKVDPLNHSYITAGLFKSFHASGLWALSHASELKTPTYVLHGADDQIISPSGSREFAAAAGSIATLKIYPSTRHEPHNDLACDEVLGDVSRFFSDLS
jgi:acylglycerol lipase